MGGGLQHQESAMVAWRLGAAGPLCNRGKAMEANREALLGRETMRKGGSWIECCGCLSEKALEEGVSQLSD